MKYITTLSNYLNEAKAKPGPKPYHTGLSDEEIKDKDAQIKKQSKMDDDDPKAYKEMPGDKEAREKGKVKTSKHVKKYHELYGDDEKNESIVTEESENAYHLRVMAGVGGDEADEFLSNKGVSLYKIRMALNNRKFTKYDLKDVIQGNAARSIEKKVMKEISESVNESKLDSSAESGLKKKSEETGVPIGILRDVYRRGMAAWKSGHRPGATQQQWAYARVNSFLTKQPGTWGGADKDLAKKVRDGGHDKKLKKG